MRVMLMALAGLGLVLSASYANAVVCAAGVHHAGCVATPRAHAAVVAPRAAVVAHPVARGAAVVRHPVAHPRVVR